jgi:hypothetical protein
VNRQRSLLNTMSATLMLGLCFGLSCSKETAQFVGEWDSISSADRVTISKDGDKYVLNDRYGGVFACSLDKGSLNCGTIIGNADLLKSSGHLTWRGMEFSRVQPQPASPQPSTPQPVVVDAPEAGDLTEALTIPAQINDPDGFTNIRAEASASSKVIGRIEAGDIFYTDVQQGDWWLVRTKHDSIGYMHRSRIVLKR